MIRTLVAAVAVHTVPESLSMRGGHILFCCSNIRLGLAQLGIHVQMVGLLADSGLDERPDRYMKTKKMPCLASGGDRSSRSEAPSLFALFGSSS